MRNFPKCMVTAHPTVGGLCLDSLEFEQIVEASNLFLSLYVSPTPSSTLLRDSLGLMQIESGLDSPVLEASYSEYGYLVTKWWLQSLWETLSRFDIVLHVPSHDCPVSLQTNDMAIMRKAVKLKAFQAKKLQVLNRVRVDF